jgi:hypothetical protein
MNVNERLICDKPAGALKQTGNIGIIYAVGLLKGNEL